jgi:hypothetical protein
MSAMTKRSGRVQKGVRRAFLIEPCREWTTRDLQPSSSNMAQIG